MCMCNVRARRARGARGARGDGFGGGGNVLTAQDIMVAQGSAR